MPRIFPVLDDILSGRARIEKGHSGTPPPGSPGAPTGLYTQVLDDGRIVVTWYPPSGGTQKGYYLYRYDDAGSPEFKKRLDIPQGGVSYYENSPTPGVTYEYYVTAFNDYGEGPNAGPVTAMVPLPPPPEPPPPPPPEPPPEVPAEPPAEQPPEPAPEPAPEPTPEPTPTPSPEPSGFVPGQNLRRISDIVRRRLEEIQKEKAAGRWPPWGYR